MMKKGKKWVAWMLLTGMLVLELPDVPIEVNAAEQISVQDEKDSIQDTEEGIQQNGIITEKHTAELLTAQKSETEEEPSGELTDKDKLSNDGEIGETEILSNLGITGNGVQLKSNEVYNEMQYLLVQDNRCDTISSMTIYQDGVEYFHVENIAPGYEYVLRPDEKDRVYKIVLEDAIGDKCVYENMTMNAMCQNIGVSNTNVTGIYGEPIEIPLAITNFNIMPSSEDIMYFNEGEVLLDYWDDDRVRFSGGDDKKFIIGSKLTPGYMLQPQVTENFPVEVDSSLPGTYTAHLRVTYHAPRDLSVDKKCLTVPLTAVVQKRPLTDVQVSFDKTKVYNGTTEVNNVGSVSYGNVLDGDDVTVTAKVSYETADAGTNKKIHINYSLSGKDAYKYVTPASQEVADGVITKTDGKGSFEISDSYYGEKISYTAESETNGNGQVTVTYRKTGEGEYGSITPNQPGTYDAKAVFAATQNYKEVSTEKSFTIRRLAPTAEMYEVNGTKGKNDWYTSAVLVSGTGENHVSATENGAYESALAIEQSGDAQFYVRTGTGAITDAVTLAGLKIDKTAPEVADGEGIVIQNNVWNSFLNNITFGVYKNRSETVTIQAHDNESGIAEIAYCVSKKGLTFEEAQAQNYIVGNEFTIGEDMPENYVVYARITNHAGLSTWLSSDGMVYDNVAPEINGIISGATYKSGSITFTIKDYCLDTVVTNATIVNKTDKEAVVMAVAGAEDTNYTVKATDKCGNTVEYQFCLQAPGKIGAGKRSLQVGTAYLLPEGSTWKVAGDLTTYRGGNEFFVGADGEFEFTQE